MYAMERVYNGHGDMVYNGQSKKFLQSKNYPLKPTGFACSVFFQQ